MNHLGLSCFSQQESPKWEEQLCGRTHSRAIQTVSILRGFYYCSRMTVYHQLAVKDTLPSVRTFPINLHAGIQDYTGVWWGCWCLTKRTRGRGFLLHCTFELRQKESVYALCSAPICSCERCVCVSSPLVHTGSGLWLDSENTVASAYVCPASAKRALWQTHSTRVQSWVISALC